VRSLQHQSLLSEHIIGKKSPEQHDVDNPHNDYGGHQNAEVECWHTVSVDKQSMGDEY